MLVDVLHERLHLVLLYALAEDQGEEEVLLLGKVQEDQESTLIVVALWG